jgi:hypothetical protein
MKVSALKSRVRRIWVPVPNNEGEVEETVWVDYCPGELTLEVQEELKAAVDSGFESDAAFVILKRVLHAWDLEDDEGNQLAVDVQTIKTIPLIFLGAIMGKIEEDSRPNPRRDVISGDGSQQTEQSDASQNGTTSSERPTGSLVDPGSS